MDTLTQILLLLGIAVVVVVTFQRLHIPGSLGYLLVGVIVGPHTVGPTVHMPEFDALAEFGVVFLLFIIGLNYSLPQLRALRHQVLWLGTGQVVLTTVVVAIMAWAAGLDAPAAFVVGAVFAQSSTTLIASLLAEQGEENSHHGRFGLAMSVFQDVTAVPFLVIIPVLGTALAPTVLAGALGLALAKAVLAFALLFFAGRWLLRPLFHAVSQRRSMELFTLAVLLVALLAAWTTNNLGLSLAFGGFLAGMMLGETEFRHQVESSIRPFRDVLLGLFFIGVGMRFDPLALVSIWPWALLGALVILVGKTLIVAALMRAVGTETRVSWRTGMMLSVGGEFGLALIAIALDAVVIRDALGQIVIASVLLAMVAGAVLIRFNDVLSSRLGADAGDEGGLQPLPESGERFVVLCGYGRVGHAVAVLLEASGVPYAAFDADPRRVVRGRAEGHAVSYGDLADPGLLAAIHVERAALVVMAVDRPDTVEGVVAWLSRMCPQVPVIARARDLEASARFLACGATHAYPETIEASLRLGETALQILGLPEEQIQSVVQDVRDWGYGPVMDGDEAATK